MLRLPRAISTALATMAVALVHVTALAGEPARTRSPEMPDLAGSGRFDVGTQLQELAVGNRVVGVRIWFPAAVARSPARVVYRHRRALPGQQAIELVEAGLAQANARPLTTQKFPLILMSHGYGGWAEHMSRLGETLSSRGYVVASIDHRDQPFTDAGSFAVSFGSVLVNRSRDQQSVLNAVLGGKFAPKVAAQIDQDAIGLIGFSMGGYGSLITAGIPLDPAAPAYAQFSPAARAFLPSPDPVLAQRVKAIVALAPWGGQPGALVWQDSALASFRKPLLLIAGDQDDVVDYERGVKRLFDTARGSDRYLLVYREAAHNIAGNPVAVPVGADFPAIEFLTDPVWRKDRIEAINAHFIGAFLDLALKGDADKRKYLDVPTPFANQGQWPSAFGQQWGGITAGDNQPGYWRGFQRRWARGLELHHKAAGE